jgi:hypothetical protein
LTDSIERAALEVLRSLGAVIGAAQDAGEENASYIARIHAKLIPLADGRSVSRRFLAKIERLGGKHGVHSNPDELVPDYIDRVLSVLEERALRPDAVEHIKTLRELGRQLDLTCRDLEVSFAPRKDPP